MIAGVFIGAGAAILVIGGGCLLWLGGFIRDWDGVWGY